MKPLLDPNVYATKKTVAQGMLDVALLTSNASQLKFLLQKGRENDFYVLMVTLISLSIILQVRTVHSVIELNRLNFRFLQVNSIYYFVVDFQSIMMMMVFIMITIIIALSVKKKWLTIVDVC